MTLVNEDIILVALYLVCNRDTSIMVQSKHLRPHLVDIRDQPKIDVDKAIRDTMRSLQKRKFVRISTRSPSKFQITHSGIKCVEKLLPAFSSLKQGNKSSMA